MITKRGKRVRAVLILAAIVVIYYISGHLWWTDSGYCWGTAAECLFEGI